MAIPTYDEFIFPLLKLLAEHREGVRSREVHGTLADRVGLTADERDEVLPSGKQKVFHNRIGWAHDRLKRAGLSESATRGVWRITAKGRDFLGAHPTGVSPDVLRDLAVVPADSRVTQNQHAKPRSDTSDATTQSPEEQIDGAIEELNDSVASELLALIHQGSPEFFEQLVLDVLVKMGYGASDLDVRRVGGAGDGGIDGVISLDRLGLEKVYVQAKRWKDTVGRPVIQSFFGALAGRRATKGVFITTSSYSAEAREYARAVSDSIVLIDGSTLAQFMIEYEVGVTVQRTVKIVRVDSDYFEVA